jgi:hypothetical protein
VPVAVRDRVATGHPWSRGVWRDAEALNMLRWPRVRSPTRAQHLGKRMPRSHEDLWSITIAWCDHVIPDFHRGASVFDRPLRQRVCPDSVTWQAFAEASPSSRLAQDPRFSIRNGRGLSVALSLAQSPFIVRILALGVAGGTFPSC